MINKLRTLRWCCVLVLAVLVMLAGTAFGQTPSAHSYVPVTVERNHLTESAPSQVPVTVERYHPAVGSWVGIATEVCQTGVAPSACTGGLPAVALFMTPTIFADGNFIGNDSLALGTAPFGPHTTAHGKWVPTSQTDFVADYVFLLNSFPPVPDTLTGARFRWVASVTSPDTMNGWVNFYAIPGIPAKWASAGSDSFPVFPSEALPLVTSPTVFYKSPDECKTAPCPFVFKFTIKRVNP